jgi:hypothetical protein
MAKVPDLEPDSPQDPFAGVAQQRQSSGDHYNTQYIVANMKRDQTKSRLMVVAGVIAVAGAIMMFLIFRPAAPEPKLHSTGTEAAAVDDGKGAKAEPPKPAEGAKPAESPK